MAGGAGIERTPKYYMPFEEVAGQILEAAEPAPTAGGAAHLMSVVSRRGEGQMVIDPVTALPDRVVTVGQDLSP